MYIKDALCKDFLRKLPPYYVKCNEWNTVY